MEDETHFLILNKMIKKLILIKKSGMVETVLAVTGVAPLLTIVESKVIKIFRCRVSFYGRN